ncbi:MAG TPA: condensation domain-containing protein, partial [Hymenobacter sp.]|nr:condensation domain-containing protein [Hymenobacter sp.]
ITYLGEEGDASVAIHNFLAKRFDLSADHMLKGELLVKTPHEHVLLLLFHHIAFDGWSIPLFVQALGSNYHALKNGVESAPEPLPIQYADYALWQREEPQVQVLQEKLTFWESALQGLEPINLPTDFSRPAVLSNQGRMLHFDLDQALTAQVSQLAQREGVTLFMTLLSVVKVFLYKYTGQQDIAIGTPVANRGLGETEPLIGFFVNTLVLRNTIDSQLSFRQLLAQVKRNTLAAFDHKEVPFDKIVSKLVAHRDFSRNPLFQVMFALQNAPVKPEDFHLDGVEVSLESQPHETAKFDLSFSVTEEEAKLALGIEYATDLFSEATIRRIEQYLVGLLEALVNQPDLSIGRFSLLTPEEKDAVTRQFNASAYAYSQNKTIVELFEQQVALTPQRTAIVFGESQVTYAELNARANQMARALHKRGVGSETLVGICQAHSPNTLVAILGILKAGAAYVPIDPDYPAERVAFMIRDAQIQVIISQREFWGLLPTDGCLPLDLDDAP